jgi:hypothetical protein
MPLIRISDKAYKELKTYKGQSREWPIYCQPLSKTASDFIIDGIALKTSAQKQA